MSEKKRKTSLSPEDMSAAIISMREATNLDFKRVGSVVSIVKTACAMANTGGGTIVLGVEDASKATGLDRLYGIGEKPECVGEIRKALVSRITPPLLAPTCDVGVYELPCRVRDGTLGRLAFLHMPKSDEVHSVVDGGTYARFGPQNRQLSASEITELSLRRGVQSAVDIPVDVPIELLETDAWREYSRQRRLTRQFPDCLKHLGLAVKESASGKWLPTAAAVLLFAEHPGGLLKRKCSVRIFHYPSASAVLAAAHAIAASRWQGKPAARTDREEA